MTMHLSTVVERLIGHRPLPAADAAAMVRRLFRDHPAPNFAVRLWDGSEVAFGTPVFTLVFTDPDTFRRCLRSADPAVFAESYVDGSLGVEGDVAAAAALSSYLRTVELTLAEKAAWAGALAVPASPHTVQRDARDVQAHYDLSDDFFRLFLDERMVYSCAYFASAGDSLEAAQINKLDLVCRKLDLRSGEDFLDIGCGWGALVIHAARHYGVRAHGITLSVNQAREARARAELAGVADRVTIEERHYADLPERAFDKIASIGMYEHVGLAKIPQYCRVAHRALRPGGLFLNHGITGPREAPGRTGGAFIFRHVFPGAEIATVTSLVDALEGTGFEILDVHSLRRHYARTLRAWYRRFLAHRARAAAVVPERVLRIWDLYLTGCAIGFDENVINVHQILAAKADGAGQITAPMVRTV